MPPFSPGHPAPPGPHRPSCLAPIGPRPGRCRHHTALLALKPRPPSRRHPSARHRASRTASPPCGSEPAGDRQPPCHRVLGAAAASSSSPGSSRRWVSWGWGWRTGAAGPKILIPEAGGYWGAPDPWEVAVGLVATHTSAFGTITGSGNAWGLYRLPCSGPHHRAARGVPAPATSLGTGKGCWMPDPALLASPGVSQCQDMVPFEPAMGTPGRRLPAKSPVVAQRAAVPHQPFCFLRGQQKPYGGSTGLGTGPARGRRPASSPGDAYHPCAGVPCGADGFVPPGRAIPDIVHPRVHAAGGVWHCRLPRHPLLQLLVQRVDLRGHLHHLALPS